MPVALAAALAAACSSPLEKPPIEQRYYTLDATRPEATTSVPRGADVVAVRRFRASPGYEGRELVFATGTGQFRTDFYNVFFAPPAAMLADEARNGWTAAACSGPPCRPPARPTPAMRWRAA